MNEQRIAPWVMKQLGKAVLGPLAVAWIVAGCAGTKMGGVDAAWEGAEFSGDNPSFPSAVDATADVSTADAQQADALAGVDVTAVLAPWVLPNTVVQTCTMPDYVARRTLTADRELAWSYGFSDTERCLVVTAGQTVRWVGNLSSHPLDAEGGDEPNPIVQHVDGVVVFPQPGTFGYVCGSAHAGMYGAIHVVP